MLQKLTFNSSIFQNFTARRTYSSQSLHEHYGTVSFYYGLKGMEYFIGDKTRRIKFVSTKEFELREQIQSSLLLWFG